MRSAASAMLLSARAVSPASRCSMTPQRCSPPSTSQSPPKAENTRGYFSPGSASPARRARPPRANSGYPSG
eukprot:2626367-Alexandrium_andersonii.AAC.1